MIADDKALAALARRLRGERRIALDTEAASYHRFFDRIYLVQVSSAGETGIIDPLAVSHLDAVGRWLADPKIEVTFHDADYDLRVLDRDYGYHGRNVFDTKIAAQLLGEPAVGLASLLEKHFGIKVDKKLQRADWSRRPLTDEMIEYAASDTRHLLPLRDELERRLREAGRLAWAQEEFARLEQVRWNPANGNDQAFMRLKGAKALSGRSLAVLRAIYAWRERKARSLDRAPFRVLGNDALVAVARSVPTTRAGLTRVKGFPHSATRRYADELLETVKEGLATPESDYPKAERSKRPKKDPVVEERLQRLKLLRNRTAKDLGIHPGVLCPNGTLHAIARAGPEEQEALRQIGELRHWQRDAVGEGEILGAVNGGKGDRGR